MIRASDVVTGDDEQTVGDQARAHFVEQVGRRPRWAAELRER
jgi:hypothetical protein